MFDHLLTPELTPPSSITSSPLLPPTPDSLTTDIVIAHYNEDLTWLGPYSVHSTIYSKGSWPIGHFRKVLTLPNWGRETHTYLYHIITNYDRLADVTLFLQGNIHDENEGTPAHTQLTLDQMVSMAACLANATNIEGLKPLWPRYRPKTEILGLGTLAQFSDWDGIQYVNNWLERRGQTLRRCECSPRQFWQWMHEGQSPPLEVTYSQGALFAVSRAVILRHPRSFYMRLYEYFNNMEETNPEEGHYMERFWLAIFEAGKQDDTVEVQDATQSEDVLVG